MITRYLYWIADGDHARGEGDAERVEALRRLWHTHRVAAAISPYDGASFWVADGRPHVRVIRVGNTHAPDGVEVLNLDDVDAATLA